MLGVIMNFFHHRLEFLDFDRLVNIFEGPEIHGLQIGLDPTIGRNHDDMGTGVEAIEFLKKGQPIHFGHIDIADDQIHPTGLQVFQGLLTVGHTTDLKPFLTEQLAQANAGILFIVHN